MKNAMDAVATKIGNLWDVIVNIIGSLCGWSLILSVVDWPEVERGFYSRLSAGMSWLGIPGRYVRDLKDVQEYMDVHSWMFIVLGTILLFGIIAAIRDPADSGTVYYDTKHLYYENCAPCLLMAITLFVASGRSHLAIAAFLALLVVLALLRTGLQGMSLESFKQCRSVMPKLFLSKLGNVTAEAVVALGTTLILYPLGLLWDLLVYSTPLSQEKQDELRRKIKESSSELDRVQ